MLILKILNKAESENRNFQNQFNKKKIHLFESNTTFNPQYWNDFSAKSMNNKTFLYQNY